MDDREKNNKAHGAADRDAESSCPARRRRALRLIGRNVLLLVAALTFIAGAAEVRLRLAWPFANSSFQAQLHPQAGSMLKPGTEMLWTNNLDYWTVSRANSLGFLDREPVASDRGAASCHVAFVGDSYVEARQVSIADKFHVRLEQLAARDLPRLDVTTSAFGYSGAGQIAQIPYYDEFARRLRPQLLALVFIDNDFRDNSALLWALQFGLDPDHIPRVTAARNADGTIELRPPDPDWQKHALPSLPRPRQMRIRRSLTQMSYFAKWLDLKKGILPLFRPGADGGADPQLIAWAEMLSRRPRYAALLDGWQPTTQADVTAMFREEKLPPIFERELEFTEFALDQFQERARRDGFLLVVLSTLRKQKGRFDRGRLHVMAESRGIPFIDYHDFVLRRGAGLRDTFWAHDLHWNPDGHLWAAEAVLEYLKSNPEVCAGAAAESAPCLL